MCSFYLVLQFRILDECIAYHVELGISLIHCSNTHLACRRRGTLRCGRVLIAVITCINAQGRPGAHGEGRERHKCCKPGRVLSRIRTYALCAIIISIFSRMPIWLSKRRFIVSRQFTRCITLYFC